jgi:hypothetical protein
MAVVWAWLEYATNWKVSSTVIAVKDDIAWVLSWGSLPSLSKTVPFIWKLAPLALPLVAWYAGYKKWKAENSYWRWLERGFMTYWVPAALLWATWLLSLPLTSQILIAWLTIKWVRHWHKLLMNSISTLKKTPSYLSSLPKKAWWKVKNPFRKKWSSTPTPAPTPTTPTVTP